MIIRPSSPPPFLCHLNVLCHIDIPLRHSTYAICNYSYTPRPIPIVSILYLTPPYPVILIPAKSSTSRAVVWVRCSYVPELHASGSLEPPESTPRCPDPLYIVDQEPFGGVGKVDLDPRALSSGTLAPGITLSPGGGGCTLG